MSKKKLIVWGASGQSLVLEEILRKDFEIVVLFDNKIMTTPFDNIPLLMGYDGFEKWKEIYLNEIKQIHFIVAIGGNKGNDRIQIHEFLKSNGLIPVNAIHPSAFIAYNAEISEGTQILANSSICVKVKLGKSVIINTAASVDHEGVIDQGVHIGPGAKLAGCVKVNTNTFIGTGCIVLPRIEIGKNCIIGAGSVVTRNIPDNVIAYGNPCKVRKNNY